MNKYGNFEITSIYNKSIKYLLVISIVLFSLFNRDISFALGFVLGGTACLINFNLMTKSFKGMISKTNYSRAFFSGSFLLRLILTTAVLASALILESVNLATAVAGILIIRIVIAWEAISKYINSFKSTE